MFKQFIEAMFCVNKDNGFAGNRISLTKTGAAIKSLSLYVGGSLSTLAYFKLDEKSGLVLAVICALIAGVGNWIEDVGKRNAMDKK